MPVKITTQTISEFLYKNLPFTIGLLAGLYFISFNIVGLGLSYFPGDLGDARFNMYLLEHARKFMLGQVNLWDAPFFYPKSNVITYSDNLLGAAPFYAFFRVLGFDIFNSFQLWFLLMTCFNYLASYLLLNTLTKNRYAAVLGAFIFTFSIALQSQVAHAQTFPRFAIPLSFLMLYKFSKQLNPKFLFFALLSVVYQVYCGIYIGFMLMIPFNIYLIAILINKRKELVPLLKDSKKLGRTAMAIGASLLLLIPFVLPYTNKGAAPSMEQYAGILTNIPDISSYLFSRKGSIIWDFLSNTGMHHPNPWNHQLFVGGLASIAMLSFSIIVLYKNYKKDFFLNADLQKTIFYIVVAALVTKLLFFRLGDVSAYLLVYFLPVFSSLKMVQRVINVELLFVAIACSVLFAYLLKKYAKLSIPIFIIVLSLLIVDNYVFQDRVSKTEITSARERTDPLIKLLSKVPVGEVISYEPTTPDKLTIHNHIDAMLAAQSRNLKSINGYSEASPNGYTNFWQNINADGRNQWFNRTRFWPDSVYVINTPEKYTVEYYDKTVGRKKRYINGIDVERIDNQILLIEANKKWMKKIEIKAKEKVISIDSMLVLDAIWAIRNQPKE